MTSNDLSNEFNLLSSLPSYNEPSIKWKASMNSKFHFFHVLRYMSRLSFTLSYFSVSISQSTFFKSMLKGGAKWSAANSIAFSRLLVCLIYVTT